MKYMRFTLAAPLQSWGEAAPWDYKETEALPTKSAIVGMISAALGYRYGDPNIQKLADSIQIAIRVDRPGYVMEDFQVVRSNKDYMVSADGEMRDSEPRVVTHKQYLQDARFVVFVQGDEKTLQKIHNALRKPVFLTYLGRKCCPTSEPILPVWVEADSLFSAVRNFTTLDKQKIKSRKVQVEIETVSHEKNDLSKRSYTRRDRVVNGLNKNYALRNVCTYYIDVQKG